jgi:hypothetical protein
MCREQIAIGGTLTVSYQPESGSEFERLLLLFAENELAAKDIERLGEILLGDRDACEYYARYVAIQAALEARQAHPPIILPASDSSRCDSLKLAASDRAGCGQPAQGAGGHYVDARRQPPTASNAARSMEQGAWSKTRGFMLRAPCSLLHALFVLAALLFVTAIAAVALHRGAARRAPGPEHTLEGQMPEAGQKTGGLATPSINTAAPVPDRFGPAPDKFGDFSNRESPQKNGGLAIPDAPPRTIQSVCLLTQAREVHWADPSLALAEMDCLAIGQEINILDGRVELTFDRGVRMVLEGRAHMRILGPLCVKAYSGNLTAHVGEHAHGFTVMTPRGNVVDLGTEFSLRLDASGAVEVAVFKGSVDVESAPTIRSPKTGALQPAPLPATRRLVAGEALCMGAMGGLSRLAAISSETFPCLSAPLSAPHGPPVIASVSDNIRLPESAQFYEIVPGGLVDGAPAYVDRFYQWTGVTPARAGREGGIPEPLRGADYVRMFNNDKIRGDYQITVQLACAAELYVFTDDRRTAPQWVRAHFQPTGWKVKMIERAAAAKLLAGDPRFSMATSYPNDADNSFSVWRMSVGQGQAVTLGSAGGEDNGNSMYGIAATASPPDFIRNGRVPARIKPGSATIALTPGKGESFSRSVDQIPRDLHTAAYWRFEDRPLGNLAPDTHRNAKPIRATTDSSYNGNDLYCYNTGLRPTFSGDVPAAVVPRSGMANRGCIAITEPTENGVSKREFYTHSQFSHASPVDLQKIEPAQWTIEASIKTKQLQHAPQVIVCRDGKVGEAARLILEINAEGRFSIRFADVQGRFHEACASPVDLQKFGSVEANRWYHVAAVSDGGTLKLFVNRNDARGYELQAVAELPPGLNGTGPGFAGTGTALGKCGDDCEWALGRGRTANWQTYGWFQGWLDEVRISDAALEPAEFLFAAKEHGKQHGSVKR